MINTMREKGIKKLLWEYGDDNYISANMDIKYGFKKYKKEKDSTVYIMRL